MRVTIPWSSYNERRYGRPWIGKVTTWPVGRKPEIEWGAFVGRDGHSGEVEIEAEPGEIIRYGQKDHRRGRDTNEWGLVDRDGTIYRSTPAVCRKHFIAGCPAGWRDEKRAQEEAEAAAAAEAEANPPPDNVVQLKKEGK